ncbi:hypothetical protein [Pelagibacterium xiamenense]|uniref:hypothetical protein n=1 Tax=Pelagibacterium xiamenense TaxID=2901140 RepID=UPI001E54D376|nr:hypothetical protein [Pelagibacterium xiamenense]MCD7058659.1 hypothetical protein [Pelagibacterium xiamenense]
MSDATSPRRMVGTFVFILAGPILWAIQLTAIYGSQSALCAAGIGTSSGGGNALVLWSVVIASLIPAGVATWAILAPAASYRLLAGERGDAAQWGFLRGVMRLLTGLSILAMAYAALGAVFLPECASLR